MVSSVEIAIFSRVYFENHAKGIEDELNGSTGEKRETKNEFVVKDVCNEIYPDDIDQDEKAGGESDWKRT